MPKGLSMLTWLNRWKLECKWGENCSLLPPVFNRPCVRHCFLACSVPQLSSNATSEINWYVSRLCLVTQTSWLESHRRASVVGRHVRAFKHSRDNPSWLMLGALASSVFCLSCLMIILITCKIQRFLQWGYSVRPQLTCLRIHFASYQCEEAILFWYETLCHPSFFMPYN